MADFDDDLYKSLAAASAVAKDEGFPETSRVLLGLLKEELLLKSEAMKVSKPQEPSS